MSKTLILLAIAAIIGAGVGACRTEKCEQHKAMALSTTQHPVDPHHHGDGSHALPFIVGWLAGENCK